MKNKIAHIVSLKNFNAIKNKEYHMCLSHLVLENEEYASFYKQKSKEGKFVLMDNGEAEKSQITIVQLYECYKIIEPTEIVLNDELCDSIKTLIKSENVLNYFRSRNAKCTYMFVPQGKTFEEWCWCLEESIKQDMNYQTIGVSKFLTIQTKDPYVRIKCCEFIEYLFDKYNIKKEVHLLGCDTGCDEIRVIFERFNFVRGTDTAFVYIITKDHKKITIKTEREKQFIDFLCDEIDEQLLKENIKEFERLSNSSNL